MAFCRLVFLLFISVVSCYAEAEVPVFLWGDLPKPSLKSNPLRAVPEEEFIAIIQEELVDDPFTVVFIEENLSVEDFSRKNIEGETSFPYLAANIGNSLYLPSVDGVLTTLDDIASDKADHVKLTENGLSAEIEGGEKFLFISLKDAREGESRSEMLRRHNDFMEKRFAELKKRYSNVIAIYTAQFPSWTIAEPHSRVRRQAGNETTGDFILNGVRLYVSSLSMYEGDNHIVLNSIPSSSTLFNGSEMITTLTYPQKELKLNFYQNRGYWSWNSVEVNSELLYPDEDVTALMGFSYRCGQNITFTPFNGTNSLNVTFIDVKVQPFFETTNNTVQFGDPYFCEGFFSVPIWAGLFVVFILLTITFYGIMMMMDIKTMDRFDDPKGKTITINAAE